MDKTLAFTIIGYFIICACFITWAAFGEHRRNYISNILAYGYTALIWVCIAALTIMTLI